MNVLKEVSKILCFVSSEISVGPIIDKIKLIIGKMNDSCHRENINNLKQLKILLLLLLIQLIKEFKFIKIIKSKNLKL